MRLQDNGMFYVMYAPRTSGRVVYVLCMLYEPPDEPPEPPELLEQVGVLENMEAGRKLPQHLLSTK